MEWREKDGVRWLEARLPGATAAFTTRTFGSAKESFAPLAALGVDPGRIVNARQAHGTDLIFHGHGEVPAEADGHVIADPGTVGLVFGADCLPIAVAGPQSAAILHCGRRGLEREIAVRGAVAVSATAAAIGPGIGPCCYEVAPGLTSLAARRAGARGAPGSCARQGSKRSSPRTSALAASPTSSSRTDATATPGARPASSGSTVRRPDVPGLIHGLDPAKIAANLERVREEAGPGVEILAATKYVPLEEMGALAEAGVRLVGENRQQDLAAKHERWGDAFEWDFIGNLQSRKVKQLLPVCRLIHSVASDSALEQLRRYGGEDTEVLVEVNVAGEDGKGGVDPSKLGAFIERCPVRVTGLMTMPPFSQDPEASRPYFARLAELAAKHDLHRLSMGTSQDWRVAVQEGATIVRLGTALYI